jgi:hypothetical protein
MTGATSGLPTRLTPNRHVALERSAERVAKVLLNIYSAANLTSAGNPVGVGKRDHPPARVQHHLPARTRITEKRVIAI